jgi:hypothetical protein
VADLNTARRGEGSCGATNTAAICAGGEIPASPYSTVKAETWNGTSWTEVGDLNTSRLATAASGTSTAALVFGGDDGSVTADTEQWDGSSWTEVANLATARKRLAGTSQTRASALAIGGYPAAYADRTEEWNAPVSTTVTVTTS